MVIGTHCQGDIGSAPLWETVSVGLTVLLASGDGSGLSEDAEDAQLSVVSSSSNSKSAHLGPKGQLLSDETSDKSSETDTGGSVLIVSTSPSKSTFTPALQPISDWFCIDLMAKF